MLISYIHFYHKESILRRHRFNIITISSCNCLINCIAVDIVDIDTISSCSSWINCFSIDIVDIIDIDSISIRYRFMIVGLAVFLSICQMPLYLRKIHKSNTATYTKQQNYNTTIAGRFYLYVERCKYEYSCKSAVCF